MRSAWEVSWAQFFILHIDQISLMITFFPFSTCCPPRIPDRMWVTFHRFLDSPTKQQYFCVLFSRYCLEAVCVSWGQPSPSLSLQRVSTSLLTFILSEFPPETPRIIAFFQTKHTRRRSQLWVIAALHVKKSLIFPPPYFHLLNLFMTGSKIRTINLFFFSQVPLFSRSVCVPTLRWEPLEKRMAATFDSNEFSMATESDRNRALAVLYGQMGCRPTPQFKKDGRSTIHFLLSQGKVRI